MEKKIKQYGIAEAVLAILTTGWVLLLLSVMLSGCMTPQKATGYLKEKGLLADTCAANFPVQSKRDTITVERKVVNQDVFDSLAKVNAELQERLDYIDGLPPVIDSSTCQDLRRKYAADINKYQLKLNRLEQRLAALKATDTTFRNTDIDSAKVAATLAENRRLQAQLTESKANTLKAENKAKNRGKMSLYSILANALLLLAVGFILAKKRKA